MPVPVSGDADLAADGGTLAGHFCDGFSVRSNNPFASAAFIASASKLSQCPADAACEVAFAGRSNAGKSSAINAITDNPKLARTSKTPGRTQLINFFGVRDDLRLVDLPGYGYAKVPVSVKQHWQTHLDQYLRNRQSLQGLILLSDIRRPLLEFDLALLNWAQEAELPLHILLTKADKLRKGPAKSTLLQVEKELKTMRFASAQLFSASKGQGIKDAQRKILSWCEAPDDSSDKKE